MATRRQRPQMNEGREMAYARFMADLLAGRVEATRLHESTNARGQLVLEYDDPAPVARGG